VIIIRRWLVNVLNVYADPTLGPCLAHEYPRRFQQKPTENPGQVTDAILSGFTGTGVAERKPEIRRKTSKSGQGSEIAVSGSFGGGVLSRLKKAGGGSFGGTELTTVRNQRAIIAWLLIPS